ncbi:MAG TPA: HAMP domain-containing sensor histidine kinase [Actinomycetota bacterium]
MSEPDLRDLDLVAVTSHEMRAPLAAIRGFVDILQRRGQELSEPEVAEFLAVISTQTERLIRMTDDLVTMTSLDAGNVTLEPEPTMLVPTLEALVRDLPDGGDRVQIRLAETAPARIETDAMRLGQALTNLLENALKYSPVDRAVVLAVEAEDDHGVRISVIDEGVGIDPDELDRVFELYYRTREGARTADGSGLGLAITRKMVSALGGQVTASSTLGEGSTFSISLPSAVR